ISQAANRRSRLTIRARLRRSDWETRAVRHRPRMGADAVARDTESGVGGVEKERRKVATMSLPLTPCHLQSPACFWTWGTGLRWSSVTTARRFWRPLSFSTAARGRGRNRGRQARSVAREAESLACSAPLPEPCGDKNQNVLVSRRDRSLPANNSIRRHRANL